MVNFNSAFLTTLKAKSASCYVHTRDSAQKYAKWTFFDVCLAHGVHIGWAGRGFFFSCMTVHEHMCTTYSCKCRSKIFTLLTLYERPGPNLDCVSLRSNCRDIERARVVQNTVCRGEEAFFFRWVRFEPQKFTCKCK